VKIRRTAGILKIALKKRRRMTKQYYKWTTIFAHICKFLLFWKCIINQKQFTLFLRGVNGWASYDKKRCFAK
uniref:Uncharacterized protein n=1 Tax=Rhinolophus ferrumequinum TaxID=59479 RepID=A0A671E178_RHIFE